jgi:hypothetical protein
MKSPKSKSHKYKYLALFVFIVVVLILGSTYYSKTHEGYRRRVDYHRYRPYTSGGFGWLYPGSIPPYTVEYQPQIIVDNTETQQLKEKANKLEEEVKNLKANQLASSQQTNKPSSCNII